MSDDLNLSMITSMPRGNAGYVFTELGTELGTASFFRVIRIKSVISSKIIMTLGHVIELNQNFKPKILFFRMNSKAAI